MNLSQNFTLEEFIASDTADRLGIDNNPSDVILGRLKIVASGMEKVRTLLGHPCFISSGYRSEALNAHVPGSSNTSAHTLGWADDFKCPGFGTPLEVAKAIAAGAEEHGIEFDQIIHEYGRWVHISFDPRHRRQLLTKLTGQPYTQGLHA